MEDKERPNQKAKIRRSSGTHRICDEGVVGSARRQYSWGV
jgi:hypothetical protein